MIDDPRMGRRPGLRFLVCICCTAVIISLWSLTSWTSNKKDDKIFLTNDSGKPLKSLDYSYVTKEDFYNYISKIGYKCTNYEYIDKEERWPLCVDKEFVIQPGNCLIYSFSYSGEFVIEKNMQEHFGCVKFFDPTINSLRLQGKTEVDVLEIGLSGVNKRLIRRTQRSWKLYTLSEILSWEAQAKVDFVKIDVPPDILIDSFKTMLYNHDLINIRQLAFTVDLPSDKRNSTLEAQLLPLLKNLELYGMKLFYQKKFAMNQDVEKYIISYINTNSDSKAIALPNAIPPDVVWDKLTDGQAEVVFDSYIHHIEYTCTDHTRVGGIGDGSWLLCTDHGFYPRPPCLVYSFGINYDFKFDEAMYHKFGCEVHSFDPSMYIKEGVRDRTAIHFYKQGLGDGKITNRDGWKLNTLGGFIKQLNHSKNAIDYLKIDVEYNEWPSMEAMLYEGSLKQVKQLGIEIHTRESLKKSPLARLKTSRKHYERYYKLLNFLKDAGFQRWSIHNNQFGMYDSTRTGRRLTCCFEMYYINKKYLPSHE